MTAEEIRHVVANGTEDDVIAAYQVVFNRDISHCLPCVKGDAKHNLLRMATAIETQGTECNWRVCKEYVGTTTVSGLGNLQPLTNEKVAYLQQAGLAHLIEEIEVALPAAEVVVDTPAEEPAPAVEETPAPRKSSRK
jgi:hypothetical protein